jgi:CPA2 family monovalent cation:H+ antiporter-2
MVKTACAKRSLAVNALVQTGSATSVILEYADKIQADIIVVGAHGRGFWEKLLIGSTTSRLLRQSQRPVLVVRQVASKSYRRIMVPIDFSPGSKAALTAARALAPEAHLVLLHAFDVPFLGKLQIAGVDPNAIDQYQKEAQQRARQRIFEWAKDLGLDEHCFTALVEQGNAMRLITEHQRQHACDLIAMGKHGSHLTQELFLGSVTKRVLSESACDVLVVVNEMSAPNLTP